MTSDTDSRCPLTGADTEGTDDLESAVEPAVIERTWKPPSRGFVSPMPPCKSWSPLMLMKSGMWYSHDES